MSNVVNDEPISTLIGKPSRVYTTGDMLTEDFVPNRVNIELSESGEIVRVWMG
ncbi:I78 family peptidase inhibitor [Pseudoalteromonas rubra]|uniref:I78 family peptidase inhibitor n=1 Tax=Pseudoalteromonas rubra TaxID=43658 RepID=UPI000F790800|nr:I78 family peptidase inhibitor [Pseudoalteromonas rubra]MEC4087166.1 I78 family peptidase inhibitor [Pseudoalteromonas rubra]